MLKTLDPFRFLLISVAGWMNQRQQHAIEYLREENRILRAQLGSRRLRLTDDQRRCLAAKARLLGRKMLAEVATLVTPETLLRWHRKLIANKYDGSASRRPGRPATVKRSRRWSSRWRRRTVTGATCAFRALSSISAISWLATRLPIF
jgi:hypothetical protein